MKCKLCEQFYKDYPLQEGSILETTGIGRRLRELCGAGEGKSNMKLCAFNMRYEDESIGVLPAFFLDWSNQEGYLVMTWYKSRGKTGRAYILCDAHNMEILTLKTAEAIIERYKNE